MKPNRIFGRLPAHASTLTARWIIPPLAAAVLAGMLSACAQTAASLPTFESSTGEEGVDLEVSPPPTRERTPSECPALTNQLFQLTLADDPAGQAEQLGYRVMDGKLQVLILLAGEDTTFLDEYQAETGTKSGDQVQAFVPFDQLCPLAKNEGVIAVRPAAQAIP